MSALIPEDRLVLVRDRLARTGAEITPQRVAQALREDGRPVGDTEVLAVHEALRREVLGAGPLEDLLVLPGVTDVVVNGADEVWLDRGAGLELSGVRLRDEESVRRLAQRLAATGGRRLDDASPYVDVRLPDGTRFHAVLAPIARPGTLISLRVPGGAVMTLDALQEGGGLSNEGAQLLRRVIDARLAFLISGGTGSGKTTLLGALLGLVPDSERVVIVEDSSELRPTHPHTVALESRPANIEKAGEVTLRVLVRQALRMRPDRLVVGEVRGAEVVDLLAALNTGHEGGCGTVHANSAADVPGRVASLALAAGLTRDAAMSQLATAIDVVIHVRRARDGTRRVGEIGVLVTDAREVSVARAVSFDEHLVSTTGPGFSRLAELLARDP